MTGNKLIFTNNKISIKIKKPIIIILIFKIIIKTIK